MPWIESKDEVDAEFIELIKKYNTQRRPKVMELLDKYSYKDVYVFKSRIEADEFLSRIKLKRPMVK